MNSDDNGIGHYGHASNFSTVQLRATLMMQWPGRPARPIDYRTTHHDLSVTLLQDIFGCQNPPTDYSVGRNFVFRNTVGLDDGGQLH